MFKPSVLKAVSYIALVCCAISLLFSLYQAQKHGIMYVMAVSWASLLYSSYLGTRLAGYDLYEADIKRLGISIYGIVILFILFSFLNIGIGIIPALYVAFRLHIQKSGMDQWMKQQKEQGESL